jgi:hypothetical protein
MQVTDISSGSSLPAEADPGSHSMPAINRTLAEIVRVTFNAVPFQRASEMNRLQAD